MGMLVAGGFLIFLGSMALSKEGNPWAGGVMVGAGLILWSAHAVRWLFEDRPKR